MIHTVKGFSIVNEAEVDVFLELSCFFYDPLDVGNLISLVPQPFLNPTWTPGSCWFACCWSLFSVHILLILVMGSSNFKQETLSGTRRNVLFWSVDLKQTTSYFSERKKKKRFIWDQQGIAIWGLQPWRVPTGLGKNTFIEGRKGGRVHGFSLTGSLPGRRRSPPVGLLSSQGIRAPPADVYVIEVSVY